MKVETPWKQFEPSLIPELNQNEVKLVWNQIKPIKTNSFKSYNLADLTPI